MDDLEGGEDVVVPGVAKGDTGDAAEREACQVGATRREVEEAESACDKISDIDVEVLDIAGGGVIEVAADLLEVEAAETVKALVVLARDGEGEAVKAATPAALEGFEDLLGVGVAVGEEMDIEGGRRGPAAGPEIAPP